jgi:4-hydroxy-tetrahydrodipicolinate reductase
MRIALLGYGRTGREVERIAIERGHHVVLRCTSAQPLHDATVDFDVAIDFSLPHLVFGHVAYCLDRSKPMVIGTTGWHDKIPALKELAAQTSASIVYGSNFSVGMHVVRDLVGTLAKHVDDIEDYDIAIQEVHHSMKLDAPGGTALTLAQIILDNVKRKTSVQSDTNGGIAPQALSVAALRVGSVPGTHTVVADSADDTIEVIHRAKNRQGFARGAVRAAEWIACNPGCHDVSDVFHHIVSFRA